MNIITLRVEDLKPYENNPRLNDNAVAPVAKSITEFGFKVPILIDKDNTIIAGHTRLKAAKELGIKEVPCIRCDDLSPEQVKAFRLADNKVAEFADWDMKLLQEELGEIGEINMEDFGFYELPEFDVDEYLENSQTSPDAPQDKDPKRIQCPYCKEWIDLP